MQCKIIESGIRCPNQRARHSQGMCWKHYKRWQRHGDPLYIDLHTQYRPKSEHPVWTGSQATYRAVHDRLRSEHGPAACHTCTDCGKPAKDWCYIGGAPDERTELLYSPWLQKDLELPFSLDQSFYQPKCRKCHIKMDKRMVPIFNF